LQKQRTRQQATSFFGVVQVFRGLFWKMGPKLVKTGYDKHTPTVTTKRT